MTRAAFAWLLAALTACGSARPSAAELDRACERTPAVRAEVVSDAAGYDAVVQHATDTLERIAGLRFERTVEIVLLREDDYRALLERAMDRALSAEGWRARSVLYRGLGAIDPDAELREVLIADRIALVPGFYDPERAQIHALLGSDAAQDRLVIVYLLAHALAIQHELFDELPDATELDPDRAYATFGVQQGVAALWTAAYLAAVSPAVDEDSENSTPTPTTSEPSTPDSGVADASDPDAGVADGGSPDASDTPDASGPETPPSTSPASTVSEPLPHDPAEPVSPPSFHVLTGTYATRAGNLLLARGRPSSEPCLDAIRAALEFPPTSSSELLRPDVYWSDEGELAPDIELHDVGDFTVIDTGRFGEANAAFLLEVRDRRATDPNVRAAAAGWRRGDELDTYYAPKHPELEGYLADAYGVYERGDALRAVWITEWRTRSDARRFADALRRGSPSLMVRDVSYSVVAVLGTGTPAELGRFGDRAHREADIGPIPWRVSLARDIEASLQQSMGTSTTSSIEEESE